MIKSQQDLYQWISENAELLMKCFLYEDHIIKLLEKSPDHKLLLDGFCDFCNKETKFIVDGTIADLRNVYLHETAICEECHCVSKNRQMLHELKEYAVATSDIYMYEQITDFYKGIKKLYPNTVGSEFLNTDTEQYSSGEVINGILHEDATKLSFRDNSFDFILSSHVFEHVFDIKKALSEAYRVLRNGGKLLISLPFCYTMEKTIIRASLVDGKIINIMPPLYHGNPLSSSGSLAVYEYGWDLVSLIEKAGFSDVYLKPYFDVRTGILGIDYYDKIFCPQIIFVAKKSDL